MKYKDKFSYKTTVTEKFRLDVIEHLKKYKNVNFLEIGCDIGLTALTLEPYFEKYTGIDIDAKRLLSFSELSNGNKKINLIQGTSEDIPPAEYDFCFIDAVHTEEWVLKDVQNVFKFNKLKNFVLIFHDYGLSDKGVKKAVVKTFDKKDLNFIGEKEDWNPLGSSPTNDHEGVLINI